MIISHFKPAITMLCLSLFLNYSYAGEGQVKDACPNCGHSLSSIPVQVAKNCRPAVVHIRTEMGNGEWGGPGEFGLEPMNPFEQFQDELMQRFFGFPGGRERGQRERPYQVSTGSGFLVSSDGYIMTNYHVVKDGSKIIVEKFDEVSKEYDAILVGCDPQSDLAVLKIAGENLPYLEFGDSDQIEVGQWTMAIGHPFKLRDSVTTGIISATHRGDLQISQLEDFIQTDASINPGNSGGPLIDQNGFVIGVNTAILSRSGGNIGVGFAVPSNIAKMVFNQIRNNGSVDRAFLGVQIQDLNDDLCQGFHLQKGTTGALIAEVMPDSAAMQAGLMAGDIVIEFNKEAIKSGKHLTTSLGKLPSGTKCEMIILREGKVKKILLTLGSRAKEISQEGDIIHKLGIIVEQITPENAHKFGVKSEDHGVAITKVIPGSIAALIGWSPGCVIMVVNGQKVSSIGDLKIALEKANPKERIIILMNYRGRASFHSIPHPNG